MDSNKRHSDRFHYNKEVKQNKNFMYNDLKRSNCYGTDFTGSNFNFTSFRGAHFKSCNFFGCTFKGTEFIGTNLKKSKFKKTIFEDTVFEAANLSGANFKDAEFKNVIFIDTDIESAIDLKFDQAEVRIYEKMPELDISENLTNAIISASKNELIKKSRVLDTKDGEINPISVMILLERFNEKSLISGLKIFSERVDKEFSTLSYIIKAIQIYEKEGIL